MHISNRRVKQYLYFCFVSIKFLYKYHFNILQYHFTTLDIIKVVHINTFNIYVLYFIGIPSKHL